MGDLSEVVVFLISFVRAFAREWLWSSCPYAVLSTPFTLLWTVCLRHAQEGRDGNTLAAARRMCESLSLSLYLSHFCAFVCVCTCVLWGIMADQTWLCGRCKFNHFFFFFLQHISESDSAQVLRPVKQTYIESDVLYMRDWIFTCAALTLAWQERRLIYRPAFVR